jgi:hypothetical protein
MKIFFLALISTSFVFTSQSQAADNFKCLGAGADSQGNPVKISLKTDIETNTLALTLVPSARQPGPYDVQTLKITKITPMFPIYSIQASKDLRPVDGALSELSLGISAEILTPGVPYPSQMSMTSTTLRGNKTQASYALTCILFRN